MTDKEFPSITCPQCHKTSYSQGDIENKFCGRCGYHSEIANPKLNVNRGEPQQGGKSDLLEFIKNKNKLAEPLMMNFARLTDEHIAKQYAPYWIGHVSQDSELTPLANAKKHSHTLSLNPAGDWTINEMVQFCYPEEPAQDPLFGVAQAGGLVVIYAHDVVWFYEPDGSQYWGRMG